MAAALQKTLPASWYCSKPIYELERQSVFLQAWYLVGPVTRYADEKKVQYELAGVHFVVERLDDENKDMSSFRVTDLASDRALPHKLTRTGLLFVALSQDAPSFEDYYPGLEALTNRFDFTELPFRRTLSYKGRFNWKTMVDGYQECLHCQYTHRAFSALYPPAPYAVHNHGHYSRHLADPAKPDAGDGLFLYFFPSCTLNRYGGGMTSFRVCPNANADNAADEDKEEEDDPEVTRMEFDYYNLSDGEAFEAYFKFVRRVAIEDYELCETAQANLAAGVYSQGLLNPVKENGVAHYQKLVRDRVVREFKKRQREQHHEQEEEEEEEGQNKDVVKGLVCSSSRAGASVLV